MKSNLKIKKIAPVYIHRNVFNEIKSLSKNSENEIFGYLVGLILNWKHEKYIVIKDQIHLKDSIISEKYITSALEGSAGDYVREYNKLKAKDENLYIVGWWHTHINLGCFLSPIDIRSQEMGFPEPYQVALVVDPIRDEYKFFTLDLKSESKYKTITNIIID
jgi:proteasome lid subunit RPN8/RPN11